MARSRLTLLSAVALVGILAAKADAAVIECKANVFIKGNYEGERYQMLLAPEGDRDKNVIIDLAEVPQVNVPGKTWDDAINSVRFFCNCTASASPPLCADAFNKTTFRIFSEPWWRKHGGGENITMKCDAGADKASCGSVLQYMPKGWGNRASALALLYNIPNYSLPLKAPAPPPGTASPSPAATSSPPPAAQSPPPAVKSPPPKVKSPPPKAKSPPPKAKSPPPKV